MSLPSETLEAFLLRTGLTRFVELRDGQLTCVDPNDPEAQKMYALALAALQLGNVTDLRYGQAWTTGTSDQRVK
jgi:hypothetical protein